MKNAITNLWLTFAQAVTICFALLLVIRIYEPTFPFNYLQKDQTSAVNEAHKTLTPTLLPATEDPALPTNSYRIAASIAMPAVVNIYTSKTVKAPLNHPLLEDPVLRFFFGDQIENFEGRTQPENSLGSGVIVSENGLILTNNHVVSTADDIEVALSDGRKLSAKIVGTDPETDLALIKVEGTQLPAIKFSPKDKIDVGDVVLAIGNPFGVGQTVTQGIVSALGRNHLGINTFENFIQTDASINPGNSGGALVNTNGELVGINSAIYSKSGGSMGIGFAIPASIAKQVVDQIAKNGIVTRGWIGIEVQDLTPALIESFGLPTQEGTLVTRVLPNSPADAAGLKAGDILTKIQGKSVADSNSMLNIIAELKPNEPATVKITRAEKTLLRSILIGKRPKPVD